MNQILQYLQQTYDPLAVILYGSYANGTNNLNSDFDALVISSNHAQYHDTSFFEGIPLDVFVYPESYFDGDYNCGEFIQIYDGLILADHDDVGKKLQTNVRAYLQNRPRKSRAENQANVDWCRKMFERIKREDAEGFFRWHWVLTDSLEIFCDIMQQPYFGPKKSLKWMEENHPAAFACYRKALQELSADHLEAWIVYLKNQATQSDRFSHLE